MTLGETSSECRAFECAAVQERGGRLAAGGAPALGEHRDQRSGAGHWPQCSESGTQCFAAAEAQ